MTRVRLIVADCEIHYSGRLSAFLPRARRLLVHKADGTLLVHADTGSKPLNWMTPPVTILEADDGWTVLGPRSDRLDITIHEVLSEVEIEPGLITVRREHPTDLGPVDILLRDPDGNTVAVEVKRTGELDAVEQLSRYLERLNQDPMLRPVRGVLVAQRIKPQTRVLAESRGIGVVEVDFEVLAGRVDPDLTLF